jgi:hypothetical protein
MRVVRTGKHRMRSHTIIIVFVVLGVLQTTDIMTRDALEERSITDEAPPATHLENK